MIYFKLMTVVIIGSVFQVCTSNPVAPEVEIDLAKLITPADLLRAKNAGFPERDIFLLVTSGLTVDEMLKMKEIRLKDGNDAFERLTKWCEILTPGLKIASNYTVAQQANFVNVMGAADLLPNNERFPFYRTSLCNRLGQPNLNSFNPKFVPHTIIRWLKRNSERYSSLERVKISKVMCCFEGLEDNVKYENLRGFSEHVNNVVVNGLSDVDMNEFAEQWNHFDTTNVPESIIRMHDFLQAKNLTDDDECKRILSIVAAK